MKIHHLGLSTQQNSRVLLLSQRKIHDHVSRCGSYEFEDVIAATDCVDMITPLKPYDRARQGFELIKRFTRSSRLANQLKPESNAVYLEKTYDLFFVNCNSPWDILTIHSIKNWRQQCRKAVCYLGELWQKDIQLCKPLLTLLQEFDHIFVGLKAGMEEIASIVGRPVSYLPPGVDAIEFCPYPKQMPRAIDVFNMGRRSEVTHQALIDLADAGNLFYYYDTPKSFSVINPREHRRLLADLIKRSRYFFTNRARVNFADQMNEQLEVGYRFFEGAAAGAVLLGEPLNIETFRQNFDWQDAVIPVPFDCPDIASVLAELDAQPERLTEIRRNNIVNSLQRHDWAYRWAAVLQQTGLEPALQMRSRLAHLSQLAEIVNLDLMPPKASIHSLAA